ncbi:glycosyltransferase [Desulfovibrio sp. OttesenSCG-928-G11]|nr:glycosyltransferase [Desulfovibrio sp. OttesenSCG-928-G11]
MVLISRKTEKRTFTAITSPQPVASEYLPPVCVLLPICNECTVIESLLGAVCAMRYPEQKLEIFVLDDSTDATSEQLKSLVADFAAKGVPMRYLRRTSREGAKAGNLRFGIDHSNAEFFAVFDADFLPPEDFLLKTMPHFLRKRLGYLQTGIEHVNRDASFITKYQAIMRRHQQYVTVELKSEGAMASLSGSSCVWRRACLESIGGWSASTATEDVDAGYSAQFGNWDYAYLQDVVSLSLLPETISAFRVQRERWGRGLVHNAIKHGRQVLVSRMSFFGHIYSISMMFSSLLLVAVYCVFLLSLPLTALGGFKGGTSIVIPLFFFAFATIWGVGNLVNSRMWNELANGGGAFRRLLALYAYISMILPMSFYYFVGAIRCFSEQREEFVITPKGTEELLRAKPRIDAILLAGEIFSFVYSLATIAIAIHAKNYTFLPLNITACTGFGMVLFWGMKDNCIIRRGKRHG